MMAHPLMSFPSDGNWCDCHGLTWTVFAHPGFGYMYNLSNETTANGGVENTINHLTQRAVLNEGDLGLCLMHLHWNRKTYAIHDHEKGVVLWGLEYCLSLWLWVCGKINPVMPDSVFLQGDNLVQGLKTAYDSCDSFSALLYWLSVY